ncbi:MAG: trehalose-phosphatase [Thauera phenolivorans]|uniref:Trehalose 6-phosphate phosphatase n=1 Tax=Thauera phenolivorans TaxID=1792543 RepID=A0A7X7R9B0_9RHOO|nr:trehalose-phosphatase [Thauera phenolivorans]
MSRTDPHAQATPTTDRRAGRGGTEAAEALLARWLQDRGARCALFLDVDGSLLDIAATPDAVVVPVTLRTALRKLHDELDGALALVSGRSIEDLDRLFHPLALPAAGAHGVEWRQWEGGELRREPLPRFPDSLRAEMHTLAAAGGGLLLEDKGASVALHYRAAPALGEALGRALTRLLAAPGHDGFRLLPGKMVYEVVGASWNKATAIARLLAQPPFAGRRPVFVGDDVTDEPAMAAMPAHGGLGLAVGREMSGASAIFDNPAAVRAALGRLTP